jgi:hypothetical protein
MRHSSICSISFSIFFGHRLYYPTFCDPFSVFVDFNRPSLPLFDILICPFSSISFSTLYNLVRHFFNMLLLDPTLFDVRLPAIPSIPSTYSIHQRVPPQSYMITPHMPVDLVWLSWLQKMKEYVVLGGAMMAIKK